jgi:type II secretory pathway component PulL
MISLKQLLKANRKIGLVFVHNNGLDLQIYSCTNSRVYWQQFISFTDIESNRKKDRLISIPRVVNWVLIIPTYQCISRYVVLPSVNSAEIEKMLEFELPNIVPYNTQPWVWDFSIIGQQQDSTSKILVVLSPLSIINRYIETLLFLDIKPHIITTSAMFHVLLMSKEEALLGSNPWGCFCFGEDHMDFFVFENMQVTFLRGNILKGEAYKNIRFIETEIQRSLSMVKEHRFSKCPSKFFAINTKGSTTDFAKIMEKVPGIPVKKVGCATSHNEHSSIMDILATIGLDNYLTSDHRKTSFNLLPRHLKEKHYRSNKRWQMALHTLKVFLVLLLAFLCLKTSIWRKNRLLERYKQRLSTISPIAEKLQFLQQQLDIIENQLQANVSTLDIVSELYRVLPKDVTVHYLSIEQNEKKIVTRAQAKLLSQAFDCIGPLEQSDYFANVRQSYANQRQIQDSVLIDFEIIADLKRDRK